MTLQHPGLRWLPQDGTLHWSRRWWWATVSFCWRHNMPTSLRQHIAGKAAYLRHIGSSTTPVVLKCSEGGLGPGVKRCKTSPIIVYRKGPVSLSTHKPEYVGVLVSHSLSLSLYLMSIGSVHPLANLHDFLGPDARPSFRQQIHLLPHLWSISLTGGILGRVSSKRFGHGQAANRNGPEMTSQI